MATTPVYGWPFETRDDPPAGYARRRDLALAVESTVATVEAATTADAILAALDGRIPGQRIATTEATTPSGTFNSQTEVLTVTADLVTGRVYKVTADLSINSDTSGDRIIARLKQDGILGADMQVKNINVEVSSGFGWSAHLEAEYTAIVDGSKTFVVTGTAVAGGSLANMEAEPDRPAWLYVDFSRG